MINQNKVNFITKYYSRKYSPLQFFLLCLLLASFFYELPVITISQYDRLNPRPFDIVLFINIVFYLINNKFNFTVIKINLIFNIWVKITLVFILCAIFWWFLLPSSLSSYSIYFAFKYIEGLIAIFLFIEKPMTNNQLKALVNIVIIGGIWIAGATYLQFFGIFEIPRYLPSGQRIPVMEGALFSTLGTAYQQTGMMSVFTFCFVISKYKFSNNILKSIIILFISLFTLGPALMAGSRAAFIAIIIAIGLLITTGRKKINIIFLLLLIIIIIYLFIPMKTLDSSTFMSIDRFVEFSSDNSLINTTQNNSIGNRIIMGPESILQVYNAVGPIMFLFGAGFYVAPHIIDGVFSYRIGYGNHDSFLFPLEQGGIITFILSTMLFWKLFFILKRGYKNSEHSREEKTIISATFLYYITFLIVANAGQVFWFIAGMEDFVVFEMIIFSLVVSKILQLEHSKYVD